MTVLMIAYERNGWNYENSHMTDYINTLVYLNS